MVIINFAKCSGACVYICTAYSRKFSTQANLLMPLTGTAWRMRTADFAHSNKQFLTFRTNTETAATGIFINRAPNVRAQKKLGGKSVKMFISNWNEVYISTMALRL